MCVKHTFSYNGKFFENLLHVTIPLEGNLHNLAIRLNVIGIFYCSTYRNLRAHAHYIYNKKYMHVFIKHNNIFAGWIHFGEFYTLPTSVIGALYI